MNNGLLNSPVVRVALDCHQAQGAQRLLNLLAVREALASNLRSMGAPVPFGIEPFEYDEPEIASKE